MLRLCIVTGYDGSDPSTAVVVHAAERAGRNGVVVIVHAYAAPSRQASDAERQRIAEERQAYGRDLLAKAASECRRVSEHVSCETTLVEVRPRTRCSTSRGPGGPRRSLWVRGVPGELGSRSGASPLSCWRSRTGPFSWSPLLSRRRKAEAQAPRLRAGAEVTTIRGFS